MTKFLLGVAIGYIFSEQIDEFFGRQTNGEKIQQQAQQEAEKAPEFPMDPPPTTSTP
jgi:hypothetical protein